MSNHNKKNLEDIGIINQEDFYNDSIKEIVETIALISTLPKTQVLGITTKDERIRRLRQMHDYFKMSKNRC